MKKNINWVFVLALVSIINLIGVVSSVKYHNWTFVLTTLSLTAILYGIVIVWIVTMKKSIEEDMGMGKFSKDTEPIELSKADQKIFFDELSKSNDFFNQHAPIEKDEIAERAFYIWEKTGNENTEENWKQAEEELKNIWYKNLK